jgi:hypothetical protein
MSGHEMIRGGISGIAPRLQRTMLSNPIPRMARFAWMLTESSEKTV